MMRDEMSRDRRIKMVEHFQKLSPPSFVGIEGPEAAKVFVNRGKRYSSYWDVRVKRWCFWPHTHFIERPTHGGRPRRGIWALTT